MQFCSIWSIDRTLSGANTLDQSRPESSSNEGVICTPQSSNFTGALPSNCLVSNPETLISGGVLPLYRDTIGVFYSLSRLGKLSLRAEKVPSWLKHMYSILFVGCLMPLAACSRQGSSSGWLICKNHCICYCFCRISSVSCHFLVLDLSTIQVY